MRSINSLHLGILVAVLATLASFSWSVGRAQGQSMPIRTVENVRTAVFAGGCFWCVEADFDKIDGVLETTSGYTGGDSDNPTYRNHSAGGHLEAVEVRYDPSRVSYEELVEFFFRHIDPTDAGGQFCDRGNSYTTAVFALNEEQAEIARAEIAQIEASGVLRGDVVTPVRMAGPFFAAEDYHQDYYLKQPLRYSFYRDACGRDQVIERVWGENVSG